MDTTTSINSETQDVDKNFLDAEHFLSNFSSLRDECERLKQENQECEIRCQQLQQELHQSQLEKQSLERHIQKEALQHKEIVWNLKIEIQKSQEERLSWKEKYLDLCIRSSQNVAKDFMKNSAQALQKEKEAKKLTKRLKKRQSKRKQTKKIEFDIEQGESTVQNEPMQTDQTTDHQQQLGQQLEQEQHDQTPKNQLVQEMNGMEGNEIGKELNNTTDMEKDDTNNLNRVPEVKVEPLTLSTIQAATGMNTVNNMVGSITSSSLAVSTVATQNQVVTSDATGYYNIPAGTFDLNNQGQGDTTTFILQTSDATFCAAAVIENPQRNEYTNATESPFVLKTNNAFDATHAAFSAAAPPGVEESDTSSDENTEFNFRCNLCNLTFSDEEMLARHMKSKHTAKTNVCKDCGKAYSTKGSLAQHVHHYHRHPNKYTCEVCDKKFNRKDFLVKHAKTHTTDREFKCKQCEKTFKTNASLSAHVNGSHNETRRFVCDFCGMRTSWRLSYLEHMKLHTGEPRKSGRRKKGQQQQQAQEQQGMQQLVDNAAVVQFITTAEA